MNRRPLTAGLALLVLALAVPLASAGVRERLLERRPAPDHPDIADEDDTSPGPRTLPAGVSVVRDVAYGSDPAQRFDVYRTEQANQAPVIFMVHGGGWSRGDKAMAAVVDNKVSRWLPAGFVFVSTNYRMLPQTKPLDQARDVARALAAAQSQAASSGGDRSKFILMGHSAGAHLVALLNASPSIATEQGASPWLGTVALDSAALDVVQTMEGRHFRLHDRAFGRSPAEWRAASPYQALGRGAPPMLAVCSTRRDDSCAQAHRFEAKARRLKLRCSVLERDLSHRQVNQELGEEGDYTRAVEAFLATLDSVVARALAARPR